MRHPILTRPVICRAVLVIAGGALAWSNGEAVAAKKFGSMDKALKDEYKRLAEESA